MSVLPEIPVWEIILRSVLVFLALIVLIRVSGKRDVGEMSPADLILLLLLSANVHTSLSGTDKSLTGGLIGAIALMATNWFLNFIAFRNRKFEKVLKGVPEVIISKGSVLKHIAKRHNLSNEQIDLAVRKEGLETVEHVRLGVIEVDGTISILKYKEAP